MEYTWDNKRQGAANVKARLDRAFGNDLFLQKFEDTQVRHIATTKYDHCMVLVDFRKHMAEDRAYSAR